MVLKRYPLIQGNVVLYLAPVTDYDVVRDIHILPQGATLPNPCTALYVAEVPDLGILADNHIGINIGRRMYIPVHQENLPAKSMVAQSSRGSLTGFPSAADL